MPAKDPRAYAALSAEIAACETELRMLAEGLETQPSEHVRRLLERRSSAFKVLSNLREEHARLVIAGQWRHRDTLKRLENLIPNQVRIIAGLDEDLRINSYDTSSLPR